jgi:transcriptional regulator with XRE-family HTH domain
MSYSKLRGKIKEVYGKQEYLAKAMGMDASSLSAKLNNNSPWKREEIEKACELLGISIEDVHLYFFSQKVGISQQ